ncbi:L-asparaginase [Longispora fulva]|uniref:L-asparaginase n=1 Tax=Longispora fulva TaxID=619741 RepID=A0A8J7KQC9_9ACTN|nr:asparaginase [Longispora fulva]MBG6137262.1 L-asparaginase [Longispora fulva]GIG61385.1 L-asparaginase [Longispora fulva]
MIEQRSAPRVVLFGLGGTIAMAPVEGGGIAPALSPAQLLAAVPGLAESGIAVDVVDFRRLPGASLGFADVHALSVAVDAALADGADGVVVAQGTDTVEETAYLLDLWHRGPRPVVVTGAMRNPTVAGHDGPANLLAAIRAAASPEVRDLGVVVVLADEIHAARRVRKTHSTSVGAFTSPNGGPLGHLVAGRPCVLNQPRGRFVVPRPAGPPGARVCVVTATLGDRGELLHGVEDRLDGLVVAGMGVGHVPEALVARLHEIGGRIPVVLASRTGAGPVLTDTYAFPGSERDLLARGLVPAGFVDPVRARLLLCAALAAGADRDTLAAAFSSAGGYTAPGTWPWP